MHALVTRRSIDFVLRYPRALMGDVSQRFRAVFMVAGIVIALAGAPAVAQSDTVRQNAFFAYGGSITRGGTVLISDPNAYFSVTEPDPIDLSRVHLDVRDSETQPYTAAAMYFSAPT